VDDTSETEPWTPQGVVFPDGRNYPPTQAHSTSCFMRVCGLAEILNQIIVHIYDPDRQSSEQEFYTCVREQERNLQEWWENLPDFLRLDASNLPLYCPPSHIVNMKYVLSLPCNTSGDGSHWSLPVASTTLLTSSYIVRSSAPARRFPSRKSLV
jgi:hypothetical protein